MSENRKALFGFIILIIIGTLMVFLIPKNSTKTFRKTKLLLDTYVTISVEAQPKIAKSAVNDAFDKMKQVENKLNRYDPKSEVSKINKKAPQPVAVSSQTFKAIEMGYRYAKITRGSFDITVGPLVSLYNFNQKRVPAPNLINSRKKLVDYRLIKLNKAQQTVALKKKGMILDLGGLAKGMAADEAYKVLLKHKIQAGLIDTGSSTLAFSKNKPGRIWKIGIRHPRKDSILAVFKTENSNISTSGDYQQYFIKSGKRYHHIIDPKTGYPAKGFVSITIISKQSGVQSDILSTALFAMKPKEAKAFLKTLPDTEAVLVDSSGRVTVRSDKLVDVPKKINLEMK